MHVTLVYNPGSGDEEHDPGALVRRLEAAGHAVRDASVKEDAWKELLADPGLVVVAGGDGTIHKVFKELAGSPAEVAVLPLGSANNIARTLGIADTDIGELIALLEVAPRTPYDLGHASLPGGEATLVEALGGGIFAQLLERADEVGTGNRDKVEAGLELLLEILAGAKAEPWEGEVDGRDVSGTFLAVEVTNIRETGPNVRLAPTADPGDGRLDVAFVRPEDRKPLEAYVAARLRGESTHAPELSVFQGRHVVLRPPPGSRLRVDDDLEETMRDGDQVVVTPLAPALRVVVPG